MCGWDLGEPGWDPSPTYIICSACSAEAGVDDLDERRAGRYLARWISEGAAWGVPSEQPAEWSPSGHLAAAGIVVRRRDVR
ncbi:hypothetical protein ASE38_12515 [Cellulomonas sp. Root930]|nr:hypothetical protein ASE38_12515 [Cellulomonas sp. Root930]